MELPFAVDATTSSDNDASSLVTASSQGSLVPADDILNLSQIGQHHHGTGEDTDEAIVSSFSMLQTGPHSIPSSSIPDANNNHLSRPPPPPHQPLAQPLFHPTIVDLPPSPSPHGTSAMPPVQHASNFTIGVDGAAATTSSSFGVDALKSAGSRVSSVLSHFGYNRSSTTGSTVPQANHSRPSGDPVVHRSTPNSSLPSSIPQHDLAPQNTSQLTTSRPVIQQNEHPDTEAVEFAYINVTDEDEVDIWLDDNHPYSYGGGPVAHNTSEGESSPPDGGRADILAVLLRGDVSLASQTTTQLVSWTEQANIAAAAAVTAKRQGHLQVALDRHADAAKLFHEAAHLVQEHDGQYIVLKYRPMHEISPIH
jgi:hypothetical protein